MGSDLSMQLWTTMHMHVLAACSMHVLLSLGVHTSIHTYVQHVLMEVAHMHMTSTGMCAHGITCYKLLSIVINCSVMYHEYGTNGCSLLTLRLSSM